MEFFLCSQNAKAPILCFTSPLDSAWIPKQSIMKSTDGSRNEWRCFPAASGGVLRCREAMCELLAPQKEGLRQASETSCHSSTSSLHWSRGALCSNLSECMVSDKSTTVCLFLNHTMFTKAFRVRVTYSWARHFQGRGGLSPAARRVSYTTG